MRYASGLLLLIPKVDVTPTERGVGPCEEYTVLMGVVRREIVGDNESGGRGKGMKKTAPPTTSHLRATGTSARGRVKATAIITRKKAQKLPSVLAS